MFLDIFFFFEEIGFSFFDKLFRVLQDILDTNDHTLARDHYINFLRCSRSAMPC